MKYLWILILTSVSFSTETISEPSDKDDIKLNIYHPSKAFIEETRIIKFPAAGYNTLKFVGLPRSSNSNSIMVQSVEFEATTKEFIYNPITKNALLQSFLGKEIVLEKYNENGKTIFSSPAKIVSFNNHPIFEIDGKIITSSNFEYIFPKIPNNLNDVPYLLINSNVVKKHASATVSYIANPFGWSADYELLIKENGNAEISAWHEIWNHSNINYNNVDVSLISGNINQIPSRHKPFANGRDRIETASFGHKSASNDDLGSIAQKLDDYVVFNINTSINLPSGSEKQIIFIKPKEIQVNKTYHFNHSLYRRDTKNKIPNPASIELSFKSEDVSDYHLPAGLIKVYENQNNSLYFVGSDEVEVIQLGSVVSLEVGKTADIVANFTTSHYEHSRKEEEFTIKAVFKNSKDKPERVHWKENIYGDWKIYNNTHDFEKLDASTIQFSIIVPAKSKTESSYKIEINKK